MRNSTITLSRSDGVGTITLNRPHRKNALDLTSFKALREAFDEMGADPQVRAVVLTGAGGDFCAGADLSAEVDPAHPLIAMDVVNATALTVQTFAKPIIARVDGDAVGAGWNLALLCDLVVATPRSRFSQIFARRGLSIDFGGSWILPRLIGMQQAQRLALLAEMIGADEAERLGLVTWIREVDEIEAFTDGVASRLAAGPPIAMRQIRALLTAGSNSSFAEALRAEATAQTVNFATADAQEGFAAFAQRREPDFTGTWMHSATAT